MKPRLLVIATLLCTLRATGANVALTQAETEVLKSVDALPTAAQIDLAVGSGSGSGLARLLELASDPMIDLGIQIRAIRLVLLYCPRPDENCSGTPIHDALLSLVQGYAARASAGTSPQDMLRLRAAVEALGATRSELAGDVAALISAPALLDHASRDVRVTVVRALRDLGSCAAVTPLQARGAVEHVGQVQQAILNALQSLHTSAMCPL
ncbi:MAG TPA: hypothetical protein VF469_40855 [Kofleriaceae bacterium]